MNDMPPPSIPEAAFNRTKRGYFGELGEGANAHVKFLQTAITREELESITLIQNIPGSETWDVRDLFQRDVDKERVTKSIIPYLKDRTKVKFFNPLTLMVIPIDPNTYNVEVELAHVTPKSYEEGGHNYEVFERPGLMQFGRHQSDAAFSFLKWNDQRVRVVAVDGQHRLSALKRWSKEGPETSSELNSWIIPAVILGFFRAHPDQRAARLLDIVRKTFVYINSEAKEVHEARRILLDDERVNSICVQELIQASHTNDCVDPEARIEGRVPLVFFDWRGETSNNRRIQGPAAIKTVEEIHAWFEHYLLGDDGSDHQELALGLTDLVPPLETFGEDKKLSHPDSVRIRKQFGQSLLPAVQFLLEEFEPYKKYIARVRQIETDALSESDLAQHAFAKLRFGTSCESEDVSELVREKYIELVNELASLKSGLFDELVARDIGMRAIVCAFGWGKEHYDNSREETSTWLEYAQWFTEAVNAVQDDGWFVSYDSQEKQRRKLLTHICFDASGQIVNYKLALQHRALGSLVGILVFHAGREGVGEETLESVWDECSEAMRVPIRSGYRKQIRSQLQTTFEGTNVQFKAEVRSRSDQAVNEHILELQEYLGVDD